MKSEENSIPIILRLADGKAIYDEIENRCAAAKKSIRALCEESSVSLATLWRMRKAKVVANLKPLVKIEKVLKRWSV